MISPPQIEHPPHQALTSHPISNIDPNSCLSEAFVLFKVTTSLFNKPSGSSCGPNPICRPSTPWANLNPSGPSTCHFELLEIDSPNPTISDKSIIQTQSSLPNLTTEAQKRKLEPTPIEKTKKIKLSHLQCKTTSLSPKQFRPTVTKKKPKLKDLARNQPPLIDTHPSPMITDIPINPNAMTEEAGHPMPPPPNVNPLMELSRLSSACDNSFP